MRIAIVARGIHKHGGGSRNAAELSDKLSQHHEVHLFTGYLESDNNKLSYHKIKPCSITRPRKLTTASEFASFAFKSYQELKHFKSDIVHVHSTASLSQDIITAHSCHKASLIKIDDMKKNVSRYHYFRSLVSPFNMVSAAIEKIQYRKANFKKIIAVSSPLKQELIDFYRIKEDNIVVIPNGVDLETFSPHTEQRLKIRRKLGFKEDDIIILFVSHRFANKGLDILIKAISSAGNKKIKLLIVSGDDAAQYLKLADGLGILNRIKLYGMTTHPETAYRASDIFVLPSYYEAFGLVTLEAMASGLPIVTTNVGCAPDLISDTHDGFVVPTPPDADKISEIIDALCRNDSVRKKIGANARNKAMQYSWDKIAAETVNLYKTCL